MTPGDPGRAASVGIFIPFLITTKENVNCCIKDKHWLKGLYFFFCAASFSLLKTIREDNSIRI